MLLASLYYSARLSRIGNWQELRFALRDFWRHMLQQLPFDLTNDVLENAWQIVAELFPYEPPLPGAIVTELAELARFETTHSFLSSVEERFGYPHGSCGFEKVRVYREPLERADTVDCLVVKLHDALADKDKAVSLLKAWMRFADLDYYRICNAHGNRLLFYEGLQHKGVYYATDRDGKEVAVGQVEPEVAAWDVPLAHVRGLATQVEEGLVLAIHAVTTGVKA